jgi:peptide/nickel transport system substrate-binding protein
LNLDPRFATDALSARLNRLLYQRLVEVDEKGLPVPGIAEWQVISPTHYRFRLNESASTFPDGHKLEAADVVKTYQTVLSGSSTSPFTSSLEMVQEVRLIDDHNLDFILKHQDPLFPAYLELGILAAEQIDKGRKFERSPFGSGSFIADDVATSGTMTIRRRSDDLLFQLVEVKNPLVRVLKLLRGEIDMLQNDLSPELLNYVSGQESATAKQAKGINFSYMGFNLEDSTIADIRVRRAIAHAINRKEIIDKVMQGAARQAESLFPPEHWAGHSNLVPHQFDPDRSRQLLAEAGYSLQKPLRLTYKTSSDPFRIRLATILQSQLSRVGIEIKIKSYDWGTFFGDIKAGNFQLYSLSWVGVRTPDAFRYIFASDSLPPTGANRGRYRSEEVDDLLLQAESSESLQEQAKIYRQVAMQVHQDLAYVPLWYEDQYLVHGQRIEGYTLSPDGNYDGLNHVRLTHTTENEHAATQSLH